MRKLIYWLLLPLAVAVSACGGKKGSSDNTSTLAMIDSVDAHGLQRRRLRAKPTLSLRGKIIIPLFRVLRMKICPM